MKKLTNKVIDLPRGGDMKVIYYHVLGGGYDRKEFIVVGGGAYGPA